MSRHTAVIASFSVEDIRRFTPEDATDDFRGLCLRQVVALWRAKALNFHSVGGLVNLERVEVLPSELGSDILNIQFKPKKRMPPRRTERKSAQHKPRMSEPGFTLRDIVAGQDTSIDELVVAAIGELNPNEEIAPEVTTE